MSKNIAEKEGKYERSEITAADSMIRHSDALERLENRLSLQILPLLASIQTPIRGEGDVILLRFILRQMYRFLQKKSLHFLTTLFCAFPSASISPDPALPPPTRHRAAMETSHQSFSSKVSKVLLVLMVALMLDLMAAASAETHSRQGWQG